MSKIDDKLNEVLGIAEEPNELEAIQKETKDLVVPDDKDPEIDFETGRKNLYNLIDKGNEAIDGILNLAKEGEHPRAYEVAGQLIKTVSEVSQNLLDLQSKGFDFGELGAAKTPILKSIFGKRALGKSPSTLLEEGGEGQNILKNLLMLLTQGKAG